MFQSNLKGTAARVIKKHTNKDAIVGMKKTPWRKITVMSSSNEISMPQLGW
jgi:hypothetical protein